MDARTHLRHTEQCYDLITMLNTYAVEAIGYFGKPDFIHTVDAIDEYLEHLNDGGYLLFEERGVNQLARYAIFRLLNNIMSALKKRRSPNPSSHLFLYSVNYKNKDPNEWYTFIVVGKSPITGRDREYFERWLRSRHDIEYVLKQKQSPDMDVTSIFHTRPEFLPAEELDTSYTRFIESRHRETFWGSSVLIAPTTDNNPYTFDILADRRVMEQGCPKILLERRMLTCDRSAAELFPSAGRISLYHAAKADPSSFFTARKKSQVTQLPSFSAHVPCISPPHSDPEILQQYLPPCWP